MLLGASGGVSNAFLHYLVHHRQYFNKLVLLDKSDKVKQDPYIDHVGLDYIFIHKELEIPKHENEYLEILKKHRIDVVLDLTDMDSIPVLEATDRFGAHYLNTAMNDEEKYVSQLVIDVHARKEKIKNNVHILCTGMNPGVVNMWVRHGIEKFGLPKEVQHFEYDTSTEALRWKCMMTWSIKEFIVESIRDPSGIMLGRDNVRTLLPNALEHRVDMTDILSPIMELDVFPHGFQVLHEENLSIAQKYNIPSQFVYAVNMKTMDFLVKKYESNKKITREDFVLGDNRTEALEGSDNIGVILKYEDKEVYYFNTAQNNAAIGTSGTYTQVIIGIFSALFVLFFDRIKKGTYFVEDLYDSHFKYFMFDNMHVREYVFEKKDGHRKLVKYNPQIKLRRKNHLDHFYF